MGGEPCADSADERHWAVHFSRVTSRAGVATAARSNILVVAKEMVHCVLSSGFDGSRQAVPLAGGASE